MADEADGAGGAGIGARLRAGREKIGLTILQAAERLHVDAKVLESLEADDFDALGAPVYARGHLRHYAELVGESATELNTLYSSVIGQVPQPDLTRIAKAPPPTGSNKLILPALVVLGVFAVAGAIWWINSLSVKKPQAATPVVVSKDAPNSSMPLTLDQTPVTPAPPPASAPAASVTQAPAATAPVVAPRPGTAAGKASVTSTSGPSSAAVPPVPAPTTEAPAHSGPGTQITLRYSADSWTEVYDGAGQRLFYDVGAANSVRVLKGTPPLRVVLGNAAGVALEVGGHSTALAKLAQKDGSAQLTVTRAGKLAHARPAKTGG